MSLIKEALEIAKTTRDEEFGRRRAADTSGRQDGARSLSDTTTLRPNRRRIQIDWQALRDGGVLAPETDDGLLARQIRDIKRPLIAHAFGKRATAVKDGNLIMVTSALAGEGKTFIAFNLARSMADERDHTVLLVDADVAKPHTSRLFGLQNDIGLLDVLEHPDQPMEAAIVDTDLSGLSILPAGRPRANATELLASVRMERLAKHLVSADPNRIVLFDSPPLIQTSESKVLAEFVGQIVFIVCAEQTPKGAVAEAVISLGEDKVVNMVLNKATCSPIITRYGSSAYGGYGSDNQHGATAVPAASPPPREAAAR